ALISLAAQQRSRRDAVGPSCYVFDSTPQDAPQSDFWSKVVGTDPEGVRLVRRGDLGSTLAAIAAEIERRQKKHEASETPMFLLVYGLQRFRELRKAEDDFNFSRRGEEAAPNPSKQFATIVREGPGVGVHTIIWCDTLNNVQRALERQGLRDFEMRVLFQMSA